MVWTIWFRYSELESPRPARTSREEDVTPPVGGGKFESREVDQSVEMFRRPRGKQKDRAGKTCKEFSARSRSQIQNVNQNQTNKEQGAKKRRRAFHQQSTQNPTGFSKKKEVRTFIRGTILEQHNFTFLKVQPCLLCQEQIRALDDVLEVRLALAVDQGGHVRDVHCFRTVFPPVSEVCKEPERDVRRRMEGWRVDQYQYLKADVDRRRRSKRSGNENRRNYG